MVCSNRSTSMKGKGGPRTVSAFPTIATALPTVETMRRAATRRCRLPAVLPAHVRAASDIYQAGRGKHEIEETGNESKDNPN